MDRKNCPATMVSRVTIKVVKGKLIQGQEVANANAVIRKAKTDSAFALSASLYGHAMTRKNDGNRDPSAKRKA